jgi:Flp pilus assembly pilin Flp
MTKIKKFLNSEEGATAIEYALLATLIGIFCLGSFAYFGDEVSDSYADSGASVRDAWASADAGKDSHKRD